MSLSFTSFAASAACENSSLPSFCTLRAGIASLPFSLAARSISRSTDAARRLA